MLFLFLIDISHHLFIISNFVGVIELYIVHKFRELVTAFYYKQNILEQYSKKIGGVYIKNIYRYIYFMHGYVSTR